ncbi:hypothetical protein GX51_02188 [Blastomyces parvus]|uniref:Uncharacterized protein n=1 Tax=Blastomyces parvus TaxID=2060905 RepID=A0A2B7XDL2_9EURO|nr:hypothetical protein GX51_02188 [Blastomyces parvus]
MPQVVGNRASLTRSPADEGDTLPQLIFPTMRSRSHNHNTSPRAQDVTEMKRRNEVVSSFAYRKSKQTHRRFARRQFSTQGPEPNSVGLKDRGAILRTRQEEFESETDGEESQDDDGDLDSDGVDTSEDESVGEEEEQPKPAASSGGIPPAGTSPIDTVRSGTDLPKTLGSGTINPSPTDSANSSPSKGGLASNPTHLAVLITGIVVVVVFIIFLATCVMIRSKKERQPGGLYSRYQGLRRNLGLASQGTLVGGYHEAPPLIEKAGMETTSKPYWDPESGFAKPFNPYVQSKPQNTEEKHISLFRKALAGAKSNIPHIKSRPKSLVFRGHNSALGFPKVVPTREEIQSLTKAHIVDSYRSPAFLAKGQENGDTQTIMPPGFTSKFSWTNTPSTNTHTRSSTHTLKPFHYTPRIDESDAGTVITEDTEPVRFRSTTSWVLQQQVKNQHHAQMNPNKPKPPPSDMDFSMSEDSHVPSGALPGLAI